MGFFKDFKEDFSDAVDELIPGGNTKDDYVEKGSDIPLDTKESNVNVEEELNKLDGLLESVSKKVDGNDREHAAISSADIKGSDASERIQNAVTPSSALDSLKSSGETKKSSTTAEEIKTMEDTFDKELDGLNLSEETYAPEEPAPVHEVPAAPVHAAPQVSDENAIITAGMSITGDISSTGHISVEGLINGNVSCNGKLTVTGTINGNSSSSEFFADAAKIQGEVSSQGTVKVGVGSVIVGNISASSAVIAGAVKGDIDVQGPVVVDTSAVVMGNIKSRSVQINNGAVIQGFCSQEYADVDVESVFA